MAGQSVAKEQAQAAGRAEERPSISVLVLCALIAMPIAALLVLATGNSGNIWQHLVVSVLPSILRTTLLLMVGVGLSAAIVGAGTAWLVSRYQFFGRGYLQWALVLPLAVPTYISAYCFVELLDFTGPVQRTLRAAGGYQTIGDYWFPDIRSLPGAIFIMAAVLYPYVYLTSRVLFEMQAPGVLDMSRLLGAGPWRSFFAVALPIARPAIAAGSMLVVLEALNDIGAVEMLGVRTLTFAIFDTWLNRSSLAGAAQISCMTLAIVAALVLLERWTRGQRRFATKAPANSRMSLVAVSPGVSLLMFLCCAVPVAIGFAAPVGVLAGYALRRIDQILDPGLAEAALNSVLVSVLTAVSAVCIAIVLAVAARRRRNRATSIAAQVAVLGYVVPGSVLAIGTLYAFTTFDNSIDALSRSLFNYSTGLLLSGTVAIVVYGCTVRFLAIAFGTIDAGLAGISGHFVMAARTLGRTANEAFVSVELPLMRRAFAVAGLLVFVDTMKELSATVLLRPFGFSTLATFVYERASRALFEDAAVAALVIVAIGMVPVLLLNRLRTEGGKNAGR
jgi:iron(III) transport system permease protein